MVIDTGIYKITNKVTGSCYIGSAVSFKKRWAQHRSHLNRNIHHSFKLQNSFNKHGDVFEYVVLLFCDKTDLIFYEQRALDIYKPKYNVSYTAGSCLGRPVRPETKLKISLALKGKPHTKEHTEKVALTKRNKTFPNRRYSEQALENIRNANKARIGFRFSDEVKLRMSEAQKGNTNCRGFKASEETKKKLSDLRKGEKNPSFGKKKSPEELARREAARKANKEAKLKGGK